LKPQTQRRYVEDFNGARTTAWGKEHADPADLFRDAIYGWTRTNYWERFTGGLKFIAMAKPKLKEHHINHEWCKGCGICVEFCPKNVLALNDQDKAVAVRLEDCIACRLCEYRCPDLAISIVCEGEEESN
jgi:2-oxoglutarate ferredoxin oxidoreductase subunit delta